MGPLLRIKRRVMSLLDTPEETPQANGVSGNIAHCNSCGRDFYVMVPPNSTMEATVHDMVCPCGNSDIVAKETVDGVAKVESPETVATD